MTDDDIREPHLRRGDFLGAFARIRQDGRTLMVQNRRVVAGVERLVWDLPGGQVEPGELLQEALARELNEEVQIEVRGTPEFFLMQEGERVRSGKRLHAWRSFFFEVREWVGEPVASREIVDAQWFDDAELPEILDAPYHDTFRRWLSEGGMHFQSAWVEP